MTSTCSQQAGQPAPACPRKVQATAKAAGSGLDALKLRPRVILANLGVLEQGRMRMQSESCESLSMLPSGPGVVSWSVVKAVKRTDVLVDVHDLSSSCLTVVHLAAEQPEPLAPRRAMLDVSVGACSSMPRHTLQPLA